ncbi:phage tail assembly protein [Lelliottia wanjuensis]|uniref:phage tail assembly protein n=1 Tax=Lelliottia wanjuensis TaxID=3050585 RepID=UPI002550F3FA|nr:phage tail assembly protein [Lelliottia sp. V106_16]MDK9356717.1 phage tail assembly protein [Lelliottia sp. V106_16]
MENEINVTLKKPVMAHGEEITSITLREPSGKDVRKNGYPYDMNGKGNITMNGSAIAAYISDLGGVNPAAVDSLHPSDMNKLGMAVIGFFLQD